jgi:hypothetical protein
VLHDPIVDVHEADRRHWERAAGHQRQLQREREHVGIGRRQRVGQVEAADMGVVGQPPIVDLDVGEGQNPLGHAAAATADERQLRRTRDHRQSGASKQRAHRRR